MGTWGPSVFENDAALDWLNLFGRLGFMAVTTPVTKIGEYASRNEMIPAEDEQAFWASCAVVACAAQGEFQGLTSDQKELISRESRHILKIPNLKRRIEFAIGRVEHNSELELLWRGSAEEQEFLRDRKLIRDKINEIL